MPEDSTVLAYCTEKQGAFDNIFRHSLENYVDRDSGTCDFTNVNFRSSLEFVNSFPFKFTGLREISIQKWLNGFLAGVRCWRKPIWGPRCLYNNMMPFTGAAEGLRSLGFLQKMGVQEALSR